MTSVPHQNVTHFRTVWRKHSLSLARLVLMSLHLNTAVNNRIQISNLLGTVTFMSLNLTTRVITTYSRSFINLHQFCQTELCCIYYTQHTIFHLTVWRLLKPNLTTRGTRRLLTFHESRDINNYSQLEAWKRISVMLIRNLDWKK